MSFIVINVLYNILFNCQYNVLYITYKKILRKFIERIYTYNYLFKNCSISGFNNTRQTIQNAMNKFLFSLTQFMLSIAWFLNIGFSFIISRRRQLDSFKIVLKTLIHGSFCLPSWKSKTKKENARERRGRHSLDTLIENWNFFEHQTN